MPGMKLGFCENFTISILSLHKYFDNLVMPVACEMETCCLPTGINWFSKLRKPNNVMETIDA